MEKNKPVSSFEGSINFISARMIFSLYFLQRKIGPSQSVISFDLNFKNPDGLNNSDIGKAILLASNNSLVCAYNAINYLKEKRLISFNQQDDSTSLNILSIKVIAEGTDMVEGVSRGDEGKIQQFNVTFNTDFRKFQVAENINIESIFKGSIL